MRNHKKTGETNFYRWNDKRSRWSIWWQSSRCAAASTSGSTSVRASVTCCHMLSTHWHTPVIWHFNSSSFLEWRWRRKCQRRPCVSFCHGLHWDCQGLRASRCPSMCSEGNLATRGYLKLIRHCHSDCSLPVTVSRQAIFKKHCCVLNSPWVPFWSRSHCRCDQVHSATLSRRKADRATTCLVEHWSLQPRQRHNPWAKSLWCGRLQFWHKGAHFGSDKNCAKLFRNSALQSFLEALRFDLRFFQRQVKEWGGSFQRLEDSGIWREADLAKNSAYHTDASSDHLRGLSGDLDQADFVALAPASCWCGVWCFESDASWLSLFTDTTVTLQLFSIQEKDRKSMWVEKRVNKASKAPRPVVALAAPSFTQTRDAKCALSYCTVLPFLHVRDVKVWISICATTELNILRSCMTFRGMHEEAHRNGRYSTSELQEEPFPRVYNCVNSLCNKRMYTESYWVYHDYHMT